VPVLRIDRPASVGTADFSRQDGQPAEVITVSLIGAGPTAPTLSFWDIAPSALAGALPVIAPIAALPGAAASWQFTTLNQLDVAYGIRCSFGDGSDLRREFHVLAPGHTPYILFNERGDFTARLDNALAAQVSASTDNTANEWRSWCAKINVAIARGNASSPPVAPVFAHFVRVQQLNAGATYSFVVDIGGVRTVISYNSVGGDTLTTIRNGLMAAIVASGLPLAASIPQVSPPVSAPAVQTLKILHTAPGTRFEVYTQDQKLWVVSTIGDYDFRVHALSTPTNSRSGDAFQLYQGTCFDTANPTGPTYAGLRAPGLPSPRTLSFDFVNALRCALEMAQTDLVAGSWFISGEWGPSPDTPPPVFLGRPFIQVPQQAFGYNELLLAWANNYPGQPVTNTVADYFTTFFQTASDGTLHIYNASSPANFAVLMRSAQGRRLDK
jgi:hypothetical protein